MVTVTDWEFPYPSRRMPVLARNVVAASQPLAAQAGLRMLQQGGNAVDAALATAIALTVVEPTMNGIGSDAFAIVWDGQRLHGLNASGRAPAGVDRDRLLAMDAVPFVGWDAVTVPGAVSAWVSLSERLGSLPFEELFEPAIRYARDGFLVSPTVAADWAVSAPAYQQLPEFADAFLPGGRPPAAGELFRHPDQATTLEAIARTAGAAFYHGELAERVVSHAAATGGCLTLEDLASHQPEWVTPISLSYAGAEVCELPGNGQGITALVALGVAALLPETGSAADRLHYQVEAMKAAFHAVHPHLGDPDHMSVEPAALLDEGFLEGLAKGIDSVRAGPPPPGLTPGGTVYLAAADRTGQAVSFIQSNYVGFGSGIVVPGTGIALQSRGACFCTTAGHPNAVGPGKRPFHTIIPGFVTRAGEPLLAFGVMGGHMQAQGHLQVLTRILQQGENPQAALDAPRWRIDPDGSLAVEEGVGANVLVELERRGHRLVRSPRSQSFGGGQILQRVPDGWLAASEPRKDGQAVGW